MRLLFAVLLLTMTACAHVGHDFDMSKVDQLTPGVSTEADAKALLGEPISVAGNASGEVLTWKYVFATGLVIGSHGQGVQIAFDQNGKMIRVTNRATV